MRALQSADVILIDDLVAPAILDFARREAKKMMVGKTGFAPSCKQDEINALMVSLAKAGRRVVRLKGGDPMIFGRAGEEIAACRKAGVPVEVVPGHQRRAGRGQPARRLAHRIASSRGGCNTSPRMARTASCPSDIDWASVADPVTTTVVYMPKRALAELAAAAQAHGLPADTPAIAVVAATRPEQEVIAGTIADIASKLDEATPGHPVLVMIGRALAQAAQSSCYFDTSPAASITGFQRVVSAAMNLSNSAIDIVSVIMPSR